MAMRVVNTLLLGIDAANFGLHVYSREAFARQWLQAAPACVAGSTDAACAYNEQLTNYFERLVIFTFLPAFLCAMASASGALRTALVRALTVAHLVSFLLFAPACPPEAAEVCKVLARVPFFQLAHAHGLSFPKQPATFALGLLAVMLLASLVGERSRGASRVQPSMLLSLAFVSLPFAVLPYIYKVTAFSPIADAATLAPGYVKAMGDLSTPQQKFALISHNAMWLSWEIIPVVFFLLAALSSSNAVRRMATFIATAAYGVGIHFLGLPLPTTNVAEVDKMLEPARKQLAALPDWGASVKAWGVLPEADQTFLARYNWAMFLVFFLFLLIGERVVRPSSSSASASSASASSSKTSKAKKSS